MKQPRPKIICAAQIEDFPARVPDQITSQAWFLRHVCKYACLLENDGWPSYIPLAKKMGIWKPSVPPFVQKIEMPGPASLPGPASSLLTQLSEWYSCGDICLRTGISTLPKGISATVRTNFVLPLETSHSARFDAYNKGHKLSVRSAQKMQINIEMQHDAAGFVSDCLRLGKTGIPPAYRRAEMMINLLKECIDRNAAILCVARDAQSQVVAGAFFSKYANRLTYHLSFASSSGRKAGAMHAIVDAVIERHSRSQYLLDFEGSMHPGIAYFMRGFGAHEELYYHYAWNSNPLCKIIALRRKLLSK
ncbi:MAG: hypothetical protein IT266_08690 [Saprospiraceae bacterium]|nr:hypothetical protein [Saprospiraceae bacterium]